MQSAEPRDTTDSISARGGSSELWKLALPLVLSSSFMTIQITLDRVMLSWHSELDVAASMPAVMLYWFPFGLLYGTALYVATFVAQYTGARRPERVGPAVWQGIYFALASGLLFLALVPLAPAYIALGDHDAALQTREVAFFRGLCFAALPALVVSSISGFFSGRGAPWTILLIDVVGTLVTGVLDWLLIFNRLDIPELEGAAGAGVATACGSYAAALTAVALFLRKRNRDEFQTLSGWRPERELLLRLFKFGGPAGIQMMLDVMAFTLFTLFVGRLGKDAMTATSIAFTINMLAFLPVMGLGNAVGILVGQSIGEGRADHAVRTVRIGFRWAVGYSTFAAALFVLAPGPLTSIFAAEAGSNQSETVATLLLFVATYCVTDSVNLVYASALRGAGDTRFVSWLTFLLAWPVMVIPTYLVVRADGNLYWCWAFATAYISVMATCFYARFRTGKWKLMKVIEDAERPHAEKLPAQATAR